jgi:Ras-related protein Rab-6A
MREMVKIKSKVCLLGDSGVGKTSLIRRFVHDTFDDHYISTIGTKISKREIKLDFSDKTVDMDMTIWDIMGHRGFRQLLQEAYFYGAQGVLAICDMTREQTLNDLDDWVDSVFKSVEKIPVIIVANKSDLEDKAQFSDKELSASAEGFGSQYVYTSAKTGDNVERAFTKLAKSIAYKNIPSLGL